jgi:predicted nucleotidyltransferase
VRSIHLNIFNDDFSDFIVALNNAGVAYVLVGGYSVILHGYHRTTGDLDIWVARTAENFSCLQHAFQKFGLPGNAFSLEEFLNDAEQDVFSFGRPPVAIDIITSIKGLQFDEVFKEAEWVDVSGLAVRLIQLPHLMQAKKAAGRYKDLDDLEHLPLP